MSKLPKLEFFAAAYLCFNSLSGLLEEGRGCLLRLFKNCANPPNSSDPPVRQIIKIYMKERKVLESKATIPLLINIMQILYINIY